MTPEQAKAENEAFGCGLLAGILMMVTGGILVHYLRLAFTYLLDK